MCQGLNKAPWQLRSLCRTRNSRAGRSEHYRPGQVTVCLSSAGSKIIQEALFRSDSRDCAGIAMASESHLIISYFIPCALWPQSAAAQVLPHCCFISLQTLVACTSLARSHHILLIPVTPPLSSQPTSVRIQAKFYTEYLRNEGCKLPATIGITFSATCTVKLPALACRGIASPQWPPCKRMSLRS